MYYCSRLPKFNIGCFRLTVIAMTIQTSDGQFQVSSRKGFQLSIHFVGYGCVLVLRFVFLKTYWIFNIFVPVVVSQERFIVCLPKLDLLPGILGDRPRRPVSSHVRGLDGIL